MIVRSTIGRISLKKKGMAENQLLESDKKLDYLGSK